MSTVACSVVASPELCSPGDAVALVSPRRQFLRSREVSSGDEEGVALAPWDAAALDAGVVLPVAVRGYSRCAWRDHWRCAGRGSYRRRSRGVYLARTALLAGNSGLRPVGASRSSAANTNSDTYSRRNAVVGIDVIEVATIRILVDTRVIEYRRIINPVALDTYRHHTRVGCRAVNRPWHRHCFLAATNACVGPAGRQNGVGHAAGIAIQNDVFHHPDFLTARVPNFHPDHFARLQIGRCRCR